MKYDNQSFNRIKDILKKDKEELSSELITLMKSDLYSVLCNYINLNMPSIELNYSIGEDNLYHFNFSFNAKSIKHITYFS